MYNVLQTVLMRRMSRARLLSVVALLVYNIDYSIDSSLGQVLYQF